MRIYRRLDHGVQLIARPYLRRAYPVVSGRISECQARVSSAGAAKYKLAKRDLFYFSHLKWKVGFLSGRQLFMTSQPFGLRMNSMTRVSVPRFPAIVTSAV